MEAPDGSAECPADLTWDKLAAYIRQGGGLQVSEQSRGRKECRRKRHGHWVAVMHSLCKSSHSGSARKLGGFFVAEKSEIDVCPMYDDRARATREQILSLFFRQIPVTGTPQVA